MKKKIAKPPLEDHELLTADEGADVLRVRPHRVYALIREGAIPPEAVFRFGRRIRLKKSVLLRWINGNTNTQAAA